MSLSLQLSGLKRQHLPRIMTPEWNQSTTLSWQTCHLVGLLNNKQQTRESHRWWWKVIQLPVVVIMLPQAINFKAAALTAYLSTLDLRKELVYGPFSCSTHKGLYLRHPLDFDLRRYAVPPRLKEMLLSLENRTLQVPLYFEDQDYEINLHIRWQINNKINSLD
jgi:hypothetical protein